MKLLSREYDPRTGVTEEYWYDASIDQVRFRKLQDVTDQIDFNKQCYNSHGNGGYKDSRGGAHHVARIPFVILEKWKKEEGFDWFNSTDKERRAKLNDPDNRFLLVRPGRL